jgi:hypothetical protein
LINTRIVREQCLTWKEHNQIHVILNDSFKASNNFVDKTYAYIKPHYRVIAELNGVIVGHQAIFLGISIDQDEKNKYAGLGLFAVKRVSGIRSLAKDIYSLSLTKVQQEGYSFAIAISNNNTVIKMTTNIYKGIILNIKMSADNVQAKYDDKLLLASIDYDDYNSTDAQNIISRLKTFSEINFTKGLF